jgi:hypothetical protein
LVAVSPNPPTVAVFGHNVTTPAVAGLAKPKEHRRNAAAAEPDSTGQTSRDGGDFDMDLYFPRECSLISPNFVDIPRPLGLYMKRMQGLCQT